MAEHKPCLRLRDPFSINCRPIDTSITIHEFRFSDLHTTIKGIPPRKIFRVHCTIPKDGANGDHQPVVNIGCWKYDEKVKIYNIAKTFRNASVQLSIAQLQQKDFSDLMDYFRTHVQGGGGFGKSSLCFTENFVYMYHKRCGLSIIRRSGERVIEAILEEFEEEGRLAGQAFETLVRENPYYLQVVLTANSDFSTTVPYDVISYLALVQTDIVEGIAKRHAV